jgi:hypothetical protein
MKDFSDCYREYILLSEAFYAETTLRDADYVDEVNFQLASHGGGTAGEMTIRWYRVGGFLSPRLECYDDAWAVLGTFKDVIDAMAEVDNQNITPKQFCQLLDKLGFVDGTERRIRYVEGSITELPSKQALLAMPVQEKG